MASTQYLQFAAILLSFFLKVGVGFVVCLCLSQILPRPDLRFRVWLSFVLAAAVYWVSLLAAAFQHFFLKTSGGPGFTNAKAATAVPIHWRVTVPESWAHDMMLVGQTVLGLYLCIMLLLACGKAWNHLRLRRLFQLGLPAPPDVAVLFNEMCAEHGISRGKLVVLPGLSSPATAYWWTPRVVLPEEIASQGATPHVASVFCHEMAHIQRRDYFWSNITDLVCGLLFFHPAIWQARDRMRLERELACDLAVVHAQPDFRIDYADNLASVVRRRMIRGDRSCAVDFAASASFLGARIRNILAEPIRMPWWKKLSAATVSATLLITFLIVSPELSVGLDFAGANAMNAGVRPTNSAIVASSHRPASTAAKAGRISSAQQSITDRTRSEASLRNVRSRSYLPETTAYRMTSGNFVTEKSASPNWDSPALSERSPATPRVATPSVASVVLGTLGQIIIHERTEHRMPGRDRDDKIVPSPSMPE